MDGSNQQLVFNSHCVVPLPRILWCSICKIGGKQESVNEYLQLTIYFILLFLPVAISYVVTTRRLHQRRVSVTRDLLPVAFLAYCCAVVSLTIIPSDRFSLNTTIDLDNHIPLINTYKRYIILSYTENYFGMEHFWKNLVGNIILFIPLGAFLLLLFRRSFLQVIAIAFACSASIELIQYGFRIFDYYRFIDIDDVILNTFGAASGYLGACLILKYSPVAIPPRKLNQATASAGCRR